MGEMVKFSRPDGKQCSGYYTEHAGVTGAPGIVVIQEWWGLNDQIKHIADLMAAAGYRALAPDLYHGKVTLEAAEAAHMMGALDFTDAVTQDVRGAVQYLKKGSAKVAALGFCMGGAVTLLAAFYVPELTAVSSWYGLPPAEAGDPRTIRIPVQGHFAMTDDYFTPAMVDEFEAKLREGGAPYEFYRYQAEHAFGNDTGSHYNAGAAKLAWQRTFDFLGKHCK